MDKIWICDRITGETREEKVYHGASLHLLYSQRGWRRLLGALLRPLFTRLSLLSKWYGWRQKSPKSRRHILPFIRAFDINTEEFITHPTSFSSFNAFFMRKLRPESRPIQGRDNEAIIPADGKYRLFQDLPLTSPLHIKGYQLSPYQLVGDPALLKGWEGINLVIARLAPADCHRFFFPCDCEAEPVRNLPGPLYSVNPFAMRWRSTILSENRRQVTPLHSPHCGTFLAVEVGATCVGSIIQTHAPYKPYKRGEEKGVFSFGGSALLLLFPPKCITFSEDLLTYSSQGLETQCLIGQPLGRFTPST
ncbi:MAG: phosphatidylserine decarboxylase [Chlamydiota bacterium]|nr:phosphatidylserine decarboxylase [Chlamydiota bacterium]